MDGTIKTPDLPLHVVAAWFAEQNAEVQAEFLDFLFRSMRHAIRGSSSGTTDWQYHAIGTEIAKDSNHVGAYALRQILDYAGLLDDLK